MASPPLIKNGISYVPAKAAAPGAGISADYITKLCRKGEVNAVVVGTTWYVDEASLADFVARTKAAKRAQAELNAQQLKEVARRAQAAEQQPPQQSPRSPEQQLLKSKFERAHAFAAREALKRGNRPSAVALATFVLLIATSASAFSNTTIRTHIAETASQLPHHANAAAQSATTFATSFKEKLPALSLPQLPSLTSHFSSLTSQSQLAQAQQSLSQRLTQNVRDLFCRYLTIGCDATSLAQSQTQQLATSQVFPEKSATTSRKLDEFATNIGGQDHATKSENVKQPASSPQTSPSDVARSAPASGQDAGSTASASSPSNAFETKPPPQPDTVAAKPRAQNPGNATSPLIQYVAVGGITQQLLESRLAQLESVLSARIQSASLASAYQSTRSSDNVADNLRNLTDDYAQSFDTNTLSADSATLGSLSTDALSVTGSGSIGGDLTVAGTITGGVLNVAGISSQGALIGPYVTATSTTATSTFAGDVIIGDPAFPTLFVENRPWLEGRGLVGIGTTTAANASITQFPLFVSASSSRAGMALVGTPTTGATNTNEIRFFNFDGTGISASAQIVAVDANYSSVSGPTPNGVRILATRADGSLWFATAGNQNSNNRLVIDSTGRSDFILATTSPDFFSQLNLRSQSTAITAGNLIGGLGFKSDDTNLPGTGSTTAGIQAFATQTHTAAALGTDLRFSVTADNTTIPFEALRITSSGDARFAQSVLAPYFTATSSSATSTFAGGISALGPSQFANFSNFFGETKFGATGTTTIASDGTIQTPSVSAQFFAATSPTATSTFAGALTVDGKVGIGTTSPATKLQVLTESSPDGLLIQRNNNGTGEYASLYFGVSAVAGGKGGILFERTASNGRGTLHLATTNDTTPGAFLTPADARLSITSTGNLGIASTSPGSLLSLGTSNGINFSLATSTFNSTGGINLASGCFALQGNCLSLGSLGLAGTQGQVAYFNGTNTAVGTSSLFIATNGRVGVGTTSPSTKLDVYNGTLRLSSSNSSYYTDFINAVDTNNAFRIQQNGFDVFHVTSAGSRTSIGSANAVLRVDSAGAKSYFETGNVGVGSTTPWAKLAITNTGTAPSFIVEDSTSPDTTPFIIDASGNVGVGIAPGAKLEVSQSGDTYIDGFQLNRSGTNRANIWLNATNDTLNITRTTVPVGIAITSSGNVGIGTTSPSLKLHISGNSDVNSGILLQNANYTGTSLGGVALSQKDNGDFTISHYGTGERLRVTSAGNVGIGSSTPNAKLVIQTGNQRLSSLSANNGIFADNGGTVGIFSLTRQDTVTTGDLSISAFGGIGLTGGNSSYSNGTASGYSLYVASSGNVGIGTTSPNYKLEVNGAIATGGNAANGALNILSTSGNLRGSLFTDGTDLALAASGGSTNLLFRTQATTRMTIDTSGLVGIGTTTPWRTLSVTGTVGFDGLTGATGAGSLCLDANKQVVYNSASDSCLSSTRDTKTDINPLVTDALEQVLALNPVSFKYKQGDARTRYGFIAEDAADVDPHLATYDAEANISGIDDRAILAIIVSAIKQLATQLTDLAATVTSFAESFTTRELTFQRAVGESLTLTRELCIADGAADTSPLCLTKSQVAALLSQIGSAASAISGASSPSKIPTPPAQNDDEDAPEIQDQSVQNPSPTGDPDLTDSAQPDNANWTPDQQPSIDNTSHATDGNPSPSPSPAASATSPAPTTETAPEPSSNTPAAAANDNLAPPASEAI